MTSEKRRIEVVGSATKKWVELTYTQKPPWILTAVFSDGETLSYQEVDLFECLRALRQVIEPSGLRICCEGARRDVFPSGMSRQMSGGRKAYSHTGKKKVIDIFEATDCSEVCTVDEQALSIRSLRDG